MVGIGKTWRFTFRNGLAVDLAAAGVVIAGRFIRFDPNGQQEFSTDSVIVTSNAVVNGAYGNGAEQDNATTKWLGGDFVATLIAPSGANGRVDVFFERKVNGQWPTAGMGRMITSIDVAATGTYNKDFSI